MIPSTARLIHAAILRPALRLLLNPRVRHAERLPSSGPAVIVANHNSHLDTPLLMTLFPLDALPRLRPVAASDYFLRGSWRAWLARRLFGIIPLRRAGFQPSEGHPLAGCSRALAAGDILIVFPEGTRGEPERLAKLRPGIAHLAGRHPDVPVIPVFLRGAGRSMPKGRLVPRPSNCEIRIGAALRWGGDRVDFMRALEARLEQLGSEVPA